MSRKSQIAFLFCIGMFVQAPCHAQTPSPLQEWQYTNATPLMKLFGEPSPEWQTLAGFGGEVRPLYDGAATYRFLGGPVFDIRFRDLAFFSAGEGLGINVIRDLHLTAGVSLGSDSGRKTSDDEANLHGLPTISRAPVIKLFANYVVSKEFPLILRIDVRQSVGQGRDGMVGDLSAYLPLPGSSRHLFMLAGPSVTWGSQEYLQKRFGITSSEAITSSHPEFTPKAGLTAVGIGHTLTYMFTPHWLLEVDSSCSWLLNSARASPLSQRTAQAAGAFAVFYRW